VVGCGVADCRFVICIPAGLEPADRDDLIPGPDSDGEGVGPGVQNNVGVIIGTLCLLGKEKAGVSMTLAN
jgi:hypothetical protein